MTTQTLNKEQQLAVEHFERKLAFEIGPYGVSNATERLQLVDLRDPESFGKGHVPKAVNVSLDDLEKFADNLDPNVMTVVYCYNGACNLATKGALLLAKKGHKVRELVGGIEEYSKQIGKLESAPATKSGGSCSCG